MEPIFTVLPFTYKKPSTDVWVLNTNDLPISPDTIVDQQFILIGPQSMGGNHKHPRREWFISLAPGLKLYWLDEHNHVHESNMSSEKDEVLLIEMPPFVPHVVKNETSNDKIILIEFSDAKMSGNEFVQVIGE